MKKKETGSSHLCTYKYSDGTHCNRFLTSSFNDRDGEQYCIFHARNDEKLQELKKQMGIEFSNASESFRKDINSRNLSEDNENHKDKIDELRLKHALNYEGIYIPDGFDLFNNFVLEVDISFHKTMFNGTADFERATFKGEVYFSNTTFNGKTSFINTNFNNEMIFSDTFFNGSSTFIYSTFSNEATFLDVIFKKRVIFFKAKFTKLANFINVFFIDEAFFAGCELDEGKLKFQDTTFFSESSFYETINGSNITFINSCFSNVSFLRSRIADIVFSNCRFNLTVEWINKKIQRINDELKSIKITDYEREILKKKSVLLQQEKDKRGVLNRRLKGLQKNNLLFEHRNFLTRSRFKLLIQRILKLGIKIISFPLLYLFPRTFKFIRKKIKASKDKFRIINFGEIQDCYMQLKVNMDRMKDYDLANDFYYGEMEMKRLGEKLCNRKRLFLSLYKFLSGYGNNPGQAIWVFFLLMALFSLPLYFDWIKIRKDINYGSMLPQTERKIEKDSFYSVLMNPLFILSPDLKANYEKKALQNVLNIDDVPDRNVLDFLSICSFNITAISNIYKPTYNASNEWASYYLGFVHYFIRPVQIALIILAIRRKVKRGEE